MVFRWTESNGERVYSVTESVSYTGGKGARETILICDPARFPFHPSKDDQPTSVTYKALRAAGELTDMRLGEVAVGNHGATFQFKGENGRSKTFLFECFIESYAAAKARFPDLPEVNPQIASSG